MTTGAMNRFSEFFDASFSSSISIESNDIISTGMFNSFYGNGFSVSLGRVELFLGLEFFDFATMSKMMMF